MTRSDMPYFAWRNLGRGGRIGTAIQLLPNAFVAIIPGTRIFAADGDYRVSHPAPTYAPEDDPIPHLIAMDATGIEIEIAEVINYGASHLLEANRLLMVAVGDDRRLVMYSAEHRHWAAARWTKEVDRWLRTAVYSYPFDEPEDSL